MLYNIINLTKKKKNQEKSYLKNYNFIFAFEDLNVNHTRGGKFWRNRTSKERETLKCQIIV